MGFRNAQPLNAKLSYRLHGESKRALARLQECPPCTDEIGQKGKSYVRIFEGQHGLLRQQRMRNACPHDSDGERIRGALLGTLRTGNPPSRAELLSDTKAVLSATRGEGNRT